MALFGTDGIRGTANTEPMTAETALKVAMAAAAEFTRGDHLHRVVIGKDTRLSGYMIEQAMTAGFLAMGMDVLLVGPMPTPAVAMLVRSFRADLGVMVSASHNPYQDNGIKLFGPDGYKLSDETEAAIETCLVEAAMPKPAAPDKIGRARRLDDAAGRYVEHVKGTIGKGVTLEGLKIVVDCANGAAHRLAPMLLQELGASVTAIGVAPDGFNINRDCGATHPQALAAAVRAAGADIGVALDGDADRVILCDEAGTVVDGDQLMALIARSWAEKGRLKGGGVVATVMSNLGLERCLASLGLKLIRTPVGDRHVVQAMRRDGFNLGGEQSGHIVFSDYATTGDGLIAALQVLAVLADRRAPLSQVGQVFKPLPQVLRNVRVPAGAVGRLLDLPQARAAIAEGEKRLASSGRLLIRKSGTEPLIRVMAEGEDGAVVAAVVDEIVAALARLSEAGPSQHRKAAG
ncbi:MAG: phosphoglucosamine mutase [Alphaproteobacteria bacterium]|nr:phosphoglucosamine mutase [Alphaproteobacteria bacterium]